MKIRLKNILHIFAISGIVLSIVFGLLLIPGLQNFFIYSTHFFVYRDDAVQNTIYTESFSPSKNIVMIKIDDISLNLLQAQGDTRTLTIPKSIYIDLIERLEGVGVKGIGFDIVFENTDPDEEAFRATLESYPNIVIATTAVSECKDVEDGGGLQRIGTGEVAVNSGSTESGARIITDQYGYKNCAGIPRSLYKNVTWGVTDMALTADRRIGKFDISGTPYADWKVESLIDTFALALYKKTLSGSIAPAQTNPFSFMLGTWKNASSITTDEVLSPFFGGPDIYSSVSLADVLSMSKVDLINIFHDTVVIVGESGTKIHDAVISPITGTNMSGMETHANFFDGLEQGKIPHAPAEWLTYLMLILTTLSAVIVYTKVPARYNPILALLVFVGVIFFGRWAYSTAGLVITIFPFLLTTSLISYPATSIYEYFILGKKKRFLESAFSRYIDPEVVRKIASQDTPVTLSGEKRDLTIFFSDIAGFTTISERLTPQALFSFMSDYLSTMTDILISEKGTLDKYIGDAIMGFFGAPMTLPNHPLAAVTTAIRMREELPKFNAKYTNTEVGEVHFRVGIATGEIIVGNIGSKDRFNYTVLGDTVNLASRLEGIGKEYHTSVTVTEEVYLATKEHFFFRKLDRIRVKGKTKPVTIYECISRPVEHIPEKYTEYERCLELYFMGKYLNAGVAFEKNSIDDPPSLVMAERCLKLIQEKRVLEDGVWEMLTK